MNLKRSNLDVLSDDNLENSKKGLQNLFLEQQLEIDLHAFELPAVRLQYYQKRIGILLGNDF